MLKMEKLRNKFSFCWSALSSADSHCWSDLWPWPGHCVHISTCPSTAHCLLFPSPCQAQSGQNQWVNNEQHRLCVSIAERDALFLVTEARDNTLRHATPAALPFPCPTDGRPTTPAPSPCRGCSSRRDRAGSRRRWKPSPSPAGGPGSAAGSAATPPSEPASRWPAGEHTVNPTAPAQQTLHLSPRVSGKCRNHLNVGWISH